MHTNMFRTLALGVLVATIGSTDALGAELPKVVLIGDSIRLGYAPKVAKLLADKVVIVSPKPNGGDSSRVLANIEEWAIREQPAIVHFNCGIHDIKKSKSAGTFQVSPEAYEANLRKIVARLRTETKAKVLFALTTPVIDDRAASTRGKADYELLEASASQFNEIARRVMKDLDVPVNDLRAVLGNAEEQGGLLSADGIHFTAAGTEKLAQAVAEFVTKHLPAGAKTEVSFRTETDLNAASEYLAGRTEWWLTWKPAQLEQGTMCQSCHTTIPYLLSRATFAANAQPKKDATYDRLLGSIRQRVGSWDKLEPYDKLHAAKARGTESVLNALALALDDKAARRRAPSELTQQAIAQLWWQQQSTGAWEWFDFNLAPWEAKAEYFGASLAAVAVASAPGYLTKASDDDQEHFGLLCGYLSKNFAQQNLHQKLTAVWAVAMLDDSGILSNEQKRQAIRDAFACQNADGGWSAASLGQWKRSDDKPQATASDGYGTALVVACLKPIALGHERVDIDRGLAWLRKHQRADDGSWPAESLNAKHPEADEGLFMRDAATGWAILALQGGLGK